MMGNDKVLSMVFLILTLLTGAALASPPVEKIICADPAIRSNWMSEQAIRKIFSDREYALAKLKISRGGCYEFYAVQHDGSIVEAYYNPISGELVRYNKIKTASNNIAYETKTTGK